MSIFLEE